MSLSIDSLTNGGIRTIVGMQSSSADPSFRPTLQMISIRNVGPGVNKEGQDRFRIVLSDGEFFVQGMLANQLKEMVDNGQLAANSVVQVEDFMNNTIQGRSLIIVLKLRVVGTADRLGAPNDIEKAGAAALRGNAAATTAAPMYNRTSAPPQTVKSNPSPAGQHPSSPSRPNPYSPSTHRTNAPIVHRGSGTSPGGTPITLISQLNMYQNRWTLKARVVSKSDIRTWSNAKGEGSLFSIELLDSSGMDIRATLFKEAVDKFYNLLVVGKVYTIAGGRIKVANMQWNTCKSQYEITLDPNSEIHLVDDEGDIQAQSFDLKKIADLEHVDAGKNVDVVAVVQEIGQVQSLTSKKTGKELQKTDLTLIDDTGVQIRLTLWGNQAVNAETTLGVHKVVAFRHARVSDYGGKSLSGGDGVFVEPKIPETEALQQWWSSQGRRGGASRSLSGAGGAGGKQDTFENRLTIEDIKGKNLGYSNEKGDYLSFKAHFTFLKRDKEGGAWYTACPNKEEPCRNRCKVTQTTDGNWQCDRCQGTYPSCTRRWIFSGTVADDTSSTWVSIFDDQAVTLLGTAADEAFAQYENSDTYDSLFAKAAHTEWVFKCRVKNEIVNDEPRLKTSVVRMDPVNYAAECRELVKQLEAW